MGTVLQVTKFVERGVLQTTWTGLTTTNTLGGAENLDRFPMHSIQIGGTFGGATATVEGSDDGITYFTLTGENPAGGADALVSATSANRFDVQNVVPHFIRPKVTGGDGTTSINVIITSKAYGH